ncbi:MAG: dihydropteroate synthase [Kiloniellales bacterium]
MTDGGPLRLTDRFAWGRQTYVMGILNVTPDSFSQDGLLAEPDFVAAALARGLDFVADGAHVLDVGGESTRPGAEAVPAAEELRRVLPVIEALAAETEVVISIDTSKAEVAAAALDAGAAMVNDVRGLRLDPELAPLVALRQVPVVLVHNRSRPRDAAAGARLGGRYVGTRYHDLIEDVARELQALATDAQAAGIAADQIILDPGIGFGKTVAQSLGLLDRLDRFKALGYPLLIGPSRKSFIGYTLDLPADERIEGTAAAVAIGIARGADMVRVHDVRQMARVARMADAILRR